MKKILVVAMLCLSALSVQAQEKVMNILKTDGTSSQTRVAEVKQIDFLNLTENNEAEQTATMIMRIINGAVFRTKVNVVNEITFADTTYNFNSSGYRILEANDLSWPEDRLLPVFSQPAVTLRSLDMSAANLSDEERVMFCTLQGIINRTRPRIILYNHNEEPQSTWPTAHSLKTSAIPTSSPYNLVKVFKSEINGLVLYSNEKTNHYSNLAVTIAGLERLLPVTAEIRDKLVRNGMDFPVVEDITELTMTNALGVYNYLYNNYWSRCNHRLLISERPNIPYVHDIGAACGSACVWLDPRNQSERQLLDKMLKDMTPGRDFVLGWYPEERSGVGEATKYGLSTVPADFFENTTVYTAVNKPVKIAPVPKRPKLENKVYATVYISDGDNIQYCQHAMAKIFEQSGRGKMAMNWTISPALADFAPMMLNYYYRKATTNDCFVSGPSGMGYAMPYDAHNSCYYANANASRVITPYTQLTQRYIEKAGLRVITVWDDISTVQRRAYAENCPYLYGLTINDWERQDGRLTTKVQSKWLPIAVQYPCYANGVDVITNFFNRDIKNFTGTKPMFVSGQATVWDVGPDKLIDLRGKLNELSPGNVNIVRADHWFSYFNEANHLPFNLTMLDVMEITSSPARTNVKLAADGSPSEGYMWISQTTNGTGWVQMDFQETFEISRYVVRHAEAAGMDPWLNSCDFTVETSLDGETWTTVGTHTGNTAVVTDASITPVEARFVRVNVTNGGTDGYVRIGDIEVYGAH
ncbi:MAG: discoidin domain-containing protein [Bacteroidaceae bacterium]|nr:discoidin domain-containing protein [Bacteroidaceae bacterium]